MSGDIVDLHVGNDEANALPEWARAMPGRGPRTREQRLLDIIEHVDRALNKNLCATDLEWQLALSLARCKTKATLIEFGRDPS